MKREALRVSCVVPTTPHAVYSAWLDATQHSAFTNSKAVIDTTVGAKYSAWDGYISGKNIQLDLGRRIIQSWRTTDFPKGAPDSRLEIHFEPVFDGTRITILHSDIPEGQGEKYKAGWNDHYFQPMRAYFGKMALKADRASMVRMQQRASQPVVSFDDDEEEEEETPKKGKAGKLEKGKPAKALKAIEAKPTKVEAKPSKQVEAKPSKQVEAKPAKVEAKSAKVDAKPSKPIKVDAKPAKIEKPSKSDKKAAKADKKAAKAEKKAAKADKKSKKDGGKKDKKKKK